MMGDALLRNRACLAPAAATRRLRSLSGSGKPTPAYARRAFD